MSVNELWGELGRAGTKLTHKQLKVVLLA